MESYSDSSTEDISITEDTMTDTSFFVPDLKIDNLSRSRATSSAMNPNVYPYNLLYKPQPSKLRRFLAQAGGIIALICKIFCIYMFFVVFVTSISFTLNFVLQILFSGFTFRHAVNDDLSFFLIVAALFVFGLYSIMIFPVLIYELYKFAADSWGDDAYKELGNRFLYTGIPQKLLYRWYGLEKSLLVTVETSQWRRQVIVRSFIIIPSIIAAIVMAVYYSGSGGLSVFPSWFLCFAFILTLCLALVFVLIGYIRVLWEDSEYYLWLRMKWKLAGTRNGQDGTPVCNTAKRILIRLGLLAMAILTPLSLHLVIWRYYVQRLPLTKEEDINETSVIVLNQDSGHFDDEQPSKIKVLFMGLGRVVWITMWFMVPFSLFSVAVLFAEVSTSAGVHTLLFFMVTFPVLALAAHKIWIPKKGVLWPLIVFLLLLFLALVGASLLMVAVLDTSNHHVHSDRTPTEPVHSSLQQGYPKGTVPGYQLCTSNWYGMDLIDFGLMSWLAYYDPYTEAFNRKMTRWFDPTDWEIRKVTSPTALVTYFDMFSRSKNVSVVGVRGTSTVLDGFEDLSLWSETLQLQIVSLVFPIVFTWPEASTSTLVHIMSYVSQVLFPPDSEFHYFKEISSYIEEIKHNRSIVLTGHSLGGSVAKVVGAKARIPAITFCSPGTVYSRKKFGITLEDIHKYSVTVKPSGDIISGIDDAGGTVQYVICDATLSFPECHYLENVMCPLIQSGCGSRTTPPLSC